MSLVVLTVPHATCPPREDRAAWLSTGDHACDFGAPRSAKALSASFRRKGCDVAALEADVPRTTMDMNRVESRSSPWRESVLGKLLRERRRSVRCLLDVHSFPRGHAPFYDCDVVLMFDLPAAVADPEQNAWPLGLAGAVQRAGAKCGLTVNRTTTDIVNQAKSDFGVSRAVLVEFCEDLRDAVLKQICDKIADYVCA